MKLIDLNFIFMELGTSGVFVNYKTGVNFSLPSQICPRGDAKQKPQSSKK